MPGLYKISTLELNLIEQAAKMIAESKTLLSMWTMGLNQSSIGTNKNLALINLNFSRHEIRRIGDQLLGNEFPELMKIQDRCVAIDPA